MQVENDYDKEVYNGDIGYVKDVDPDEGELTASFDGRSVAYGFGELDTLVPAYAATIHKSQGSEYPAVVIPVMTQHYTMLQRNLLTPAFALSSWWARRRPLPSRFAVSLGGAAGRSLASGCARRTLQVNLRERNQGLGPSGDNPSRKMNFTPFVQRTPSGFEFSEATTRAPVQVMMPGLRWSREGLPLRCSTRRQASPNSRSSAQEHRPRRKRRDFSPPRCRPRNALAANPPGEPNRPSTYVL
jgi:hypothetical protein